MNMKKSVTFLLVGALAVTAVFGAIAYRSANAQAVTPTAPSTTTTAPANTGAAPIGRGHGMEGGVTSQNLATALGITTDQLSTAYTKANSDALAQAVKAGLITQAQADQLQSNGTAFPFENRWSGWLSQNGIDYNALLATALGISTDKLQAAYITAYNTGIDQAVTNGNLTQAQADQMKGQYALYNNKTFQTAMQSAFQSAVSQAVSSGVITQAQADAILKSSTGLFAGGKGGFGGDFDGGFGGGRGFGGGHGRGFDQGGLPANPGTQTNPTTPSNPTTPANPTAAPSTGA